MPKFLISFLAWDSMVLSSFLVWDLESESGGFCCRSWFVRILISDCADFKVALSSCSSSFRSVGKFLERR